MRNKILARTSTQLARENISIYAGFDYPPFTHSIAVRHTALVGEPHLLHLHSTSQRLDPKKMASQHLVYVLGPCVWWFVERNRSISTCFWRREEGCCANNDASQTPVALYAASLSYAIVAKKADLLLGFTSFTAYPRYAELCKRLAQVKISGLMRRTIHTGRIVCNSWERWVIW
jgi:hypothetical protein